MNDRVMSVWPTGQRSPHAQLREAGYVSGSEADVERIPPAVAAYAIAMYTRPGDLVVDPDCGAGTVLTEALRAGRHALGLTVHKQSWTLARANVSAAKGAGAWRDGSVLEARPMVLATACAAGLIGRVGLVLTSMRTRPDCDPAGSACGELAKTLLCCEPLLRAGGYVVVVVRPHRHEGGALVDLTTPVIAAGTSAGLTPVDRCIALSAELRGRRVVTHASLAERRAASQAGTNGRPIALNAHHEALVFQRAHDAELAGATTDSPWLVERGTATRSAVNGMAYPGWRRAA